MTVHNPDPTAADSSPASLPITSPVPTLTAVAPVSVATGVAATVTLTGTGFTANSSGLDLRGDLHVTELTNVVIAFLGAGPAEKDVACALHGTLALYDPETLIRIAALSARRLKHRPARFLDLKKEWIIFISEKQREKTARADTPYSNNFYCTVL